MVCYGTQFMVHEVLKAVSARELSRLAVMSLSRTLTESQKRYMSLLETIAVAG